MSEFVKSILQSIARNAAIVIATWVSARGFIPPDKVNSSAEVLAGAIVVAAGVAWSFVDKWLTARKTEKLAVSTAQLVKVLDPMPNTKAADEIVSEMAAQLAPSQANTPVGAALTAAAEAKP